MIVDAKVNLKRFLEIFADKTIADTAESIAAAFDETMQIVRNARQDANTVKITAAFPIVYQKLLEIVPSVLALYTQAIENLK